MSAKSHITNVWGALCCTFQILRVIVAELYHMMKQGEDADDPGARHTLPGCFSSMRCVMAQPGTQLDDKNTDHRIVESCAA